VGVKIENRKRRKEEISRGLKQSVVIGRAVRMSFESNITYEFVSFLSSAYY